MEKATVRNIHPPPASLDLYIILQHALVTRVVLLALVSRLWVTPSSCLRPCNIWSGECSWSGVLSATTSAAPTVQYKYTTVSLAHQRSDRSGELRVPQTRPGRISPQSLGSSSAISLEVDPGSAGVLSVGPLGSGIFMRACAYFRHVILHPCSRTPGDRPQQVKCTVTAHHPHTNDAVFILAPAG